MKSCVEPVAEYLLRLPDKERVPKHVLAIGRQRGEGQLYFLTPDDLQRHGLPDWMRGCHSLHRPHPSVAKHLEQQGRDPQTVLQTRTVPIWTVADLYAAHDVQTVRLFKVDAEGADAEILLSLVDCCVARGGGWPMIVQFEDNELSDRDQLARAVAALEQHGYRQADAHDADRTYIRLSPDRPAATDLEWLSLDPPVLRHGLTHGLPELYWDLGPQRVYRLICLRSYVGYDQLQRWYAMMRKLRPQDVFHILCNEAWMADRMRLDGIPAHAVNHNLFVDDSLFQVRHRERDFDAICVARLNPQKRIEMAAGIRGRLLLVGGSHPDWDPPGYAERLKARLPRAVSHGNWQKHVGQDEVVTLMNRAKVGLCLSICEGGDAGLRRVPALRLPRRDRPEQRGPERIPVPRAQPDRRPELGPRHRGRRRGAGLPAVQPLRTAPVRSLMALANVQ